MNRKHLLIIALVAIATALALIFMSRPAAAQQTLAFMPRGGRQILLGVAGTDAAWLKEVASSRKTQAQWLESLGTRGGLGEREKATLAAYLEVNMPLSDSALAASDLAAVLPPDGRTLAENECQSCHSLFSGYLTQSRDVQGWRNVFLSPFHKQLKLDARAREEFARYSALNMPMKIDDVPQDLRF